MPAWRHAFNLRVLVFVEYENEVEEEVARLKALLEKLRIDATTCVFWLASKELRTYETIINGSCEDGAFNDVVESTLSGEDWWEELKDLRGGEQNINIPGAGPPASLASPLTHRDQRAGVAHRRPSMVDMRDLHPKPNVSMLSRLGVNVGIHTHRLGDDIFGDQLDQLDTLDTDGETSEIDATEDISDSDTEIRSPDPASEGDAETTDPSTQPLLGSVFRRRSLGDVLRAHKLTRADHRADREPRELSCNKNNHPSSYGTVPGLTSFSGDFAGAPPDDDCHVRPLIPSQNVDETRKHSNSSCLIPFRAADDGDKSRLSRLQGPIKNPDIAHVQAAPGKARLQSPTCQLSSHALAAKSSGTATRSLDCNAVTGRWRQEGDSSPSMQNRPALSRQSSAMRFSSKPLPETMTDVEGHSGPTIMFADSDRIPIITSPQRPTLSRQSSASASLRRQRLDSSFPALTETSKISFSRSQHEHQRTGHPEVDPDKKIDIPRLVESFRDQSPASQATEGSTYSTQSLPLSFNDLPSRAQHLILNELMRNHSTDTALVFTTLPIPSEGTCLDENATLRYLSDIEVLCHDLPPMLLVLSNSMSVTVGL